MRESRPNLLCVLLIHELRVVVFLSLHSLPLFLGNKLLSAKKRKYQCEMASDCGFAKNLPPKMPLFFAFGKMPNDWLIRIALSKI